MLSDSCGQAQCHHTLGGYRHCLTHVHTQAREIKREEAARYRISSSCWWSQLFMERRSRWLSIWHNVWHHRESSQVATKLTNRTSPPLFLPAFMCLLNTRSVHDSDAWAPSHSGGMHAGTHTPVTALTCLSFYIRNVGDEEVGEEMIGLKILLSSTEYWDFCAQVQCKVI